MWRSSTSSSYVLHTYKATHRYAVYFYVTLESTSSSALYVHPTLSILLFLNNFQHTTYLRQSASNHSVRLPLGFHLLRTRSCSPSPYPKRPRCLGTNYSEVFETEILWGLSKPWHCLLSIYSVICFLSTEIIVYCTALFMVAWLNITFMLWL